MILAARRIVFPLLALVLLVPACAGTHPPPQYVYDHKASFSGMTTYAWYADPNFKMPHGDSIVDGRFIDEHVRAAVDAALGRKGIQKVNDGSASMYVSYNTGDTGVASEDKDPNYEWLTGYSVATVYEKERTITVNIRNSAKKLIWVGSISRLEGENPNGVARSLDSDIGTLLGHFPPSP